MATAKTSERASSSNASEAICTVIATAPLQPTTSPPSSGVCNTGPNYGFPAEACPATPSQGTVLAAPGTCAQTSARPVSDQGECTVTPPATVSPAATMTPDAERTYTHVSTH
jgi:hypothetical protein